MTPDRIDAFIDAALANWRMSWSIGTFGAIAEFHRDSDEAVTIISSSDAFGCVSTRGGVRLTRLLPLVPIAFETASAQPGRWGGTVALCMPSDRCDLAAKQVITALGPDREALRASDAGAQLFDMGVGMAHVRACIRTRDPALIATLTAAEGKAPFAEGNGAMDAIVRGGPHRVFLSRAGRIEVYQPIPAPGGVTPLGPHTHVLPKLIKAGRTHSANAPIPAGLLPVVTLHPESAFVEADGRDKTGFDVTAAGTLDALIAAFGLDPEVRLTNAIVRSLASPVPDGLICSRRDRTLARIAIRKALRYGRTVHVDWAQFDNAADDPQGEVTANAA